MRAMGTTSDPGTTSALLGLEIAERAGSQC